MYITLVQGFAATASFRVPENHTYHQTLPLPPITTLIGIMGAAMGLDYSKAMDFRKQRSISFGINGIHNGQMNDLWKYRKVVASKNKGPFIEDVLIREYLTDLNINIAIGAEEVSVIKQIRKAFLNPYYALSAGNSDDLLKVYRVSKVIDVSEEKIKDFENTILPGDRAADYKPDINFKKTPIIKNIRAPQVFLLPTAFNFTGEERRVSSRDYFTFVSSPIKLRQSIGAYKINNIAYPLI